MLTLREKKDDVSQEEINKLKEYRRAGADIKRLSQGTKYAILKNPDKLTERQKATLELLPVTNPSLNRAYELKERLRVLLKLPAEEIGDAIDEWRGRAWRSRLPGFVKLAKKLKKHKDAIIAMAVHHLSNARIEATNNTIKCIIRQAYGFRNTDNLIALIMLRCAPLKPSLFGR